MNSQAPQLIQAKLTIGQPGDKYEQEADRVAEEVMRMPEPKVRTRESVVGGSRLETIQRACSKSEEEVRRQPVEEEEKEEKIRRQVEEEDAEEVLRTKPLAAQISPLIQRQAEPPEEDKEQEIQAKPLANSFTPLLQRQLGAIEEEEDKTLQTKPVAGRAPRKSASLYRRIDILEGGGQPLPPSESAFFEPRFGADFSRVRVHADRRAEETARAVNARAFTLGRNIVMGVGQYSPGSSEGRRLLAHELAHVRQQGGASLMASRWTRQGDSEDLAGPAFPVQILQRVRHRISRRRLDVPGIRRDINDGLSTPPQLFSWLHIRGDRQGKVADSAPSAPPNPVVTSQQLPIRAYFFPSELRHHDRRALVLGGFHGDERPGFEIADALLADLQSGRRLGGEALHYHTIIIPHVNEGGIQDELAGYGCGSSGRSRNCYDTRCNRALVDINRDFPIRGRRKSSRRCRNTGRLPTQPETQGIITTINQFQPHRILSIHAISNPRHAGIFADPTTSREARGLACSMAGLIVERDNRTGNLRSRGVPCNPEYPQASGLPGTTLGAYGATRTTPIPVITMEVPCYDSLQSRRPTLPPPTHCLRSSYRGPSGARDVGAFMGAARGFLIDPARVVTQADREIVRDILALSVSQRRLFLTGRLATSHSIYRRIQERIDQAVTALNALSPPSPIRVISRQRAFLQSIRSTGAQPGAMAQPGASPQARIFLRKLMLSGYRQGARASAGLEWLPDSFFIGGNRRRGLDKRKWLALSAAIRVPIILRYSALPGASRHHWGTDVDFNSVTEADWAAIDPRTSRSARPRPGRFYQLGVWLNANASRVGFIKVYTPRTVGGRVVRAGGHEPEAWHFTYAPIARQLREAHLRDVRIVQDIVNPLMTYLRQHTARGRLPSDLEAALRAVVLRDYLNAINPGLL